MSKKLFLLTSFVLVLSLVSNVSAYDTRYWDNNMGTGDQLWQTTTNWDPEGELTSDDWVIIEGLYTNDGNGPIIDGNTNAVCEWIDMGYYAAPPEEAVLTMVGGTLTVGTYICLGDFSGGGDYRFDTTDSDVNLLGEIWLGYDPTSQGIVNVTNSQWTIGDDLEIGYYGDGIFNMNSGTITIADWLDIGGVYDDTYGSGHLNLHGGTINVTTGFAIGGAGLGTIDITDGVLIVGIDLTVSNDWMFYPGVDTPDPDGGYTGTLPILISMGIITAYDVNSGEIITDDVNYPAEAGRRAVVNVDYDVTTSGKTTLSATTADPNLAWNPSPIGGGQTLPVTLIWSAGENAASHEVYFGTSFADVNDATTASDPNIYRGPQPLADVNYAVPETLVWDTTYFWRVDEVNNPTWKGIVWSFATLPAKATEPYPADDAEYIRPDVVLHWTQGFEAVTHEVYIGTNWDDVNDATTTVDPNNVYKGPQVYGVNTYDAGTLEDLLFDTYYYWRIDEVNLDAAVPRWKGDVWNFWVDYYLVVDEFEYLDLAALRAVWKDWNADPRAQNKNDAQLFLETDEDHVYGGDKSVRYTYRCYKKSGPDFEGSYAEADASVLGAGTDWTIGGAKALVLYFQGDPTNGTDHAYPISVDQMYVELADGDAVSKSGIVKYDTEHGYDMNDIKEPSWHEWNIDLADPCLADVNLANVAKVYIGFGGVDKTGQSEPGAGDQSLASDTVWFDDIELWPPRCRTEFVATDFTGDCITDFADVRVMSEDWLFYDYNTIAAAPSGPNLIGYWKFDEAEGNTVEDSSGYGHDGVTVDPTPSWVTGYPNDPCDSAMSFDGLGDYVVCAEREGNSPGIYDANLMPDKFTVSCWLKLDEFLYFSSFVGNGIDSSSDECGFFLYNWGWIDPEGQDFGLAIRTETDMHYVETLPIYDTKRWYHLAATYDGQYVNIYVDGVPAAGPTDVGPIRWISTDSDNYPEHFTIGSWEDVGYSLHVDGKIDEVRFYDYALPQGQIAILAEIVAVGVEYYQPVPSLANLTDPEAKFFRKVNFRDFVILADHWLEGPTLWP